MAAYSKNLPPRAPWGPYVIPDQGCWYPWPFWPGIPQAFPDPYIPQAFPDPYIPQATPDPYIPQSTPDPYIPQATPSPYEPSSSAPQGNPPGGHELAHWLGFSDGRKGVWRPDRFVSQSDKMHYRMGWKEGKQNQRFANVKRSPFVLTQPTK